MGAKFSGIENLRIFRSGINPFFNLDLQPHWKTLVIKLHGNKVSSKRFLMFRYGIMITKSRTGSVRIQLSDVLVTNIILETLKFQRQRNVGNGRFFQSGGKKVYTLVHGEYAKKRVS